MLQTTTRVASDNYKEMVQRFLVRSEGAAEGAGVRHPAKARGLKSKGLADYSASEVMLKSTWTPDWLCMGGA